MRTVPLIREQAPYSYYVFGENQCLFELNRLPLFSCWKREDGKFVLVFATKDHTLCVFVAGLGLLQSLHAIYTSKESNLETILNLPTACTKISLTDDDLSMETISVIPLSETEWWCWPYQANNYFVVNTETQSCISCPTNLRLNHSWYVEAEDDLLARGLVCLDNTIYRLEFLRQFDSWGTSNTFRLFPFPSYAPKLIPVTAGDARWMYLKEEDTSLLLLDEQGNEIGERSLADLFPGFQPDKFRVESIFINMKHNLISMFERGDTCSFGTMTHTSYEKYAVYDWTTQQLLMFPESKNLSTICEYIAPFRDIVTGKVRIIREGWTCEGTCTSLIDGVYSPKQDVFHIFL